MLAQSVWLDAQGAQNRVHFDRGIPRYVSEHLRALLEVAPEIVHTVALSASQPLTGNLAFLPGTGRGALRTWRDRPPDPLPAIYHVMSPFELDRSANEIWPQWAHRREVATVVTLYDLIPLVFPEHYLHDPLARARYTSRANLVRAADQVLAISRATARDAQELLGISSERITVIDAGVASSFRPLSGDRGAARATLGTRFPGIRDGFLLYVAGIEFRKNIDRLVDAYARLDPALRTRHQLVIACKALPEERAHVERVAAEAGVRAGELVLTGYVTDSVLAALYRLAHLFVFASFYEGSGLPILEAMACDLPVIASNTSTSPEILGDLDATFDPYDPADMARVIASTASDEVALERLRARSRRRVADYTWERVAHRTLDGYAVAAASARRRAIERRRPRVALVTPWPPERSGIADYNAQLAPALARHTDVDVVVDGRGDDRAAPEEPGLRLLRSDAFRWWADALRVYDCVLYCVGNSRYHGWIYELLRRRPGAVVAHDVRLTGFYGWYAGQERPEDPNGRLAERIDEMYGDRVDAARWLRAAPTPEEQEALGLYMTGEVQVLSHGLVVHSRFAADVLRLDRDRADPVASPVHVVPHALPPVRAGSRRPSADAPLVVSFGVVSRVKGLGTLVEAFAVLADRHPTVRLVLAGGGEGHELRQWVELADRLGVGDRVEVPGHLPAERYEELLAWASVTVQLRLTYNGEASGAVAKSLAAGVPTVVTDVGWFAELPPDVAVRVPRGVAPDALAAEIERLLVDDEHADRIGAAARAYAATTGYRAVARRYAEAVLPGPRRPLDREPAPPPQAPPPLAPAPLTVVMPAHNRRDRVLLTLEALARQTTREFALVVSDDGSDDDTRLQVERLARSPRWRGRLAAVPVPGGPSGNVARPRNVGAAHAAPGSSLVLFVDSDVVLVPDAIERALELHRNHPQAALFALVHWLGPYGLDDVKEAVAAGPDALSAMVPRARARRLEGTIVGIDPRGIEPFSSNASARPVAVRPELAVGAVLGCPTADYRRLGGYDETFGAYGYEDMEFGIRLARAGVPAVHAADVVGFHVWHAKPGWARMSLYNERNLDLVLRRHGLDSTPDTWADWSVWWHYHADRGGRVVQADGRLWAIDRGRRFRLELPSPDWVERLGHSPDGVEEAALGTLDELREAGVAAELPVRRGELEAGAASGQQLPGP